MLLRTSVKKKLGGAGFTLVETLLYLAIASSLLLGVSAFMGIMFQARIKAQVIAEVEQQGAFAMESITSALRNSNLVADPVPGETKDYIVFNTPVASTSPQAFGLSNGLLTETVGSQQPR